MTGFQNNALAYVESFGVKSVGNSVTLQRDPNSTDTNYPIGTFWINQTDDTLFYLNSLSSTGGTLSANWKIISASSDVVSLSDTANTRVFASDSSSTPPNNIQLEAGTGIDITADPTNHKIVITNTGTASTETITGDDGTAVSPSGGTIILQGKVVNNGTHPTKAVYTEHSGASNQENIDVQVTTAIAAADVTKVGLAAFNSAQFQVDGTNQGFISLKGSSVNPPTTGFHVDITSGTGVDPVVADSSGNVTIKGGTLVATGSLANAVRTDTPLPNIINIELQKAGSNPATSTANNFGVSQFDSNSFTVTSGFVTLNNAGTTGAITSVFGNDGSGAKVTPSSGSIQFTGITIANNTYTRPLYFRKNSSSIEECNIQLTTTSTSGTKNVNKSGICHFDSTSFAVDAATGFVTLTGGGGGATLSLGVDAATAPGTNPTVPNGSGSIIIEGGATYATGTRANPIRTNSLAANTIDLQIQLAGSNASVSTPNNFGVAQFDANQFTVTSGYVQLKGATGNPPIQDIDLDNSTTPIFAASNGHISLKGGTIAATGTSSTAIQTSGSSSNDAKLNLQYAGSNPATSTANNFGVAQFDSNSFTVTSGFVTLNNAGTTGAVTKFALDAGTTPITPSAGSITITGAQVATGVVGTNVIRSNGTAANACTIQIQRTTTSGSSNVALNGVCHFDSSKFGVDANGFVTFTGSTSNIPWTDQGGNFNASSNNGYFCTALLAATLPATPAQGDIIRFVCDTSSAVTITANTGQKIRIGNVISASAGTAASTRQGDALDLVYRSSSATWYAFSGAVGTWGIT